MSHLKLLKNKESKLFKVFLLTLPPPTPRKKNFRRMRKNSSKFDSRIMSHCFNVELFQKQLNFDEFFHILSRNVELSYSVSHCTMATNVRLDQSEFGCYWLLSGELRPGQLEGLINATEEPSYGKVQRDISYHHHHLFSFRRTMSL